MTDTHQVSGQVTQSMLLASEAIPWPYAVDLVGAGVRDESALRSTASWVSWDEYLGLLRGLTGGVNTPESFVQCGVLSMEHSARGVFRHLGMIVGGAKPLYQAVFGWVMKSLLRRVHMDLAEVSPGRLRIEVRVDEQLSPSEPFFHTLVGTMTALPRSLGRPDAMVEADIHPHHAVYDVILPSHGNVWARLRRSWSALFDQRSYDAAFVRLRENISELLGELRSVNVRLVDSEARWRSLAEGIPGLVLVADEKGSIQGPFGTTEPDRAVVDEIHAAFGAPSVRDAVMRRGELGMFKVVGSTEDVTWCWTCRASKLPGESRAVIVAIDDTERMRAAQDLREREQRLLQAQKMEALGRLSGGVAHDFNNLLAAIQGHADLLGLTLGADPYIADHLRGIVAAVDDASGLTRQLLAYGRSTPTRVVTVDATEAVRSHAAMYARLVGDAVTVTTDLDAADQFVRVDPSQLQQVLLNLVINGRDAMATGGTLTIRSRVVVEDGADWVALEVCDEGVGMAADVLQRAMEPFFTTKGVGRGTGLGLSTVYWIVEQVGGRLQIESTPDLGTCVHVLLPRVDRPLPQKVGPVAQVHTTGSETILLVEDDDRVRAMVASMLETQGYHVLSCSHAADARRVIETLPAPPALLLTDITMPGESGLSLANDLAIRFEQLPIVLMSGYTSETPELDAPHRHRGQFLPKPFGLRDLAHALRTALDEATA